MSRAGYAQLSSASFAPIIDRHGNPPLAIDPKEVVPFDLQHEGSGGLHGNEIVIQFLALSG